MFIAKLGLVLLNLFDFVTTFNPYIFLFMCYDRSLPTPLYHTKVTQDNKAKKELGLLVIKKFHLNLKTILFNQRK